MKLKVASGIPCIRQRANVVSTCMNVSVATFLLRPSSSIVSTLKLFDSQGVVHIPKISQVRGKYTIFLSVSSTVRLSEVAPSGRGYGLGARGQTWTTKSLITHLTSSGLTLPYIQFSVGSSYDRFDPLVR